MELLQVAVIYPKKHASISVGDIIMKTANTNNDEDAKDLHEVNRKGYFSEAYALLTPFKLFLQLHLQNLSITPLLSLKNKECSFKRKKLH